MDLIADVLAYLFTAALGLAAPGTVPLERQVERTYQVAPGATVRADLSGGRIVVVPSPSRTARVTLVQRVHTANQRDADAALDNYTVELGQTDGNVQLTARWKRGVTIGLWRQIRVNMDAELAVPSDVVVDLHTSGGSIDIRGMRTARVNARTSGGSISVEGGNAPIDVDTSGGSIRIGEVAETVRAHTSGGSIRISKVTTAATVVDAQTSGGSVHVGIDPAARLWVDASTSGGSVSVSGLPLATASRSRTKVEGTLNGGGGRLRAHTSGGSVRIAAY